MNFVWGALFVMLFLVVVTYLENFKKVNRMIFPLEPEVIRELRRYFPFYRHFSFRRKRKFETRVKSFLNSFDYQLRGNMRLTPEVRAILGGTAARISMYLPEMCFNYYNVIVLYPSVYRSKFTGRKHKGEVNPGARIIVFSWEAVMEGINRSDDGLNLLLHEYAHALYFEHMLMKADYEVFNEEAYNRVMAQAEIEIEKIRRDEPHLLRKYAATNMEEFFAVAVENFFERSAEFKKGLPELYGTLVLLFRQDPLRG
ncbi:MAG: zinc-dependent peptidase [Bacteroidota bacterium]